MTHSPRWRDQCNVPIGNGAICLAEPSASAASHEHSIDNEGQDVNNPQHVVDLNANTPHRAPHASQRQEGRLLSTVMQGAMQGRARARPAPPGAGQCPG